MDGVCPFYYHNQTKSRDQSPLIGLLRRRIKSEEHLFIFWNTFIMLSHVQFLSYISYIAATLSVLLP